MRTYLRALIAIAWKDMGVWVRRPSTIVATVLPAVGFMIIILISAQAVGRNPVALVVLDRGPQATRLAHSLETSNAFRVRTETPERARQLLHDLDVAAVITIPAGFDETYSAHRSDPVTIEINNLNLDFTNDLRRSLPAAITDFYAGQNDSPVLVQVQEHDLRSQDVSLVQFDLIPNLALLLTVAGVVNCGLATAREFEDLTIKELTLAPIARSALVGGKLLAGWTTTMSLAAIVLVGGAAAGLLRPAGWYWLPALVVVALFGLAAAGLGALLGASIRRFQPVIAIGINLSLYLFFLSGGISVAAFLPDWVQTVARFTPTYYGVHALQQAIFYQSTDLLGQDLLVLGGTAALTVAAGALALRRSIAA
ncbi:MAG: ABC transporter permease [Candidatus Dormibacteraeota bacterium]|uniref:ABC transporter permease n=1 Tax=Candidatus Dormiibacter inghamiae TaxID=3127013 RepID=A0A934NGI1_9BACT|nr:ABC transporter permease [Candidatus Dormibacteraeota bacterium]MBJ7607092.1 ABC transporter permease [Candidatus Dormibacteraeota bacterium]